MDVLRSRVPDPNHYYCCVLLPRPQNEGEKEEGGAGQRTDTEQCQIVGVGQSRVSQSVSQSVSQREGERA
jgi:hypothetical protein